MLDRATIDRLSRAPEKNAQALNVALAEEGRSDVLLSLARSPSLGPEALAVLAARVAAEGDAVGRAPPVHPEDHVPVTADLDRLLVAHPRAPGDVRDAVLSRHPADPFFVLAAASHPAATATAVLRAVDWPSASPAHDRLWLALIDPAAVAPLTLEEWSQDESPLRREAAARIARDPALHAAPFAADRSRQVRRALASNRFAAEARARPRRLRSRARHVPLPRRPRPHPPPEGGEGAVHRGERPLRRRAPGHGERRRAPRPT